MNIKIINNSNNELPTYRTEGSTGFDLRAWVDETNEDALSENVIIIKPSESVLVKTGLQISIPIGYELELRGISELALKNKIQVHNGTIDSDFSGDFRSGISIILFNFGTKPFIIKNGDRIAQGILKQVYQCNFVEVKD